MRKGMVAVASICGFVALAVAACGDNLIPTAPDGPPADAPPECAALTVGTADFQFNAFGQLTGLRYRVEPGLGGAAPDYLLVELYDSTTEGLPVLAPGTFDLTAAPDADLATCQHCVWLWQDSEDGVELTTVFYASAGSLVLDQVDDPFSPVFVGHTSDLTIRATTFDPTTGHTEIIDGGTCFAIAPLAFDTRTTPGRACGSAEDCGNPLLEICDPASATCSAPQCDEFFSCPEDNSVCMSQYHDIFQGACYTGCDPTASTCPTGQACIQLGVDPAFGVCRHIGSGASGATCTVEDISTSCVADLTCDDTSDTCLPTCSYFATDTGCTAGNACYVLGGCRPTSSGSAAAIGQPCGAGYVLADGCASDGEAFRGICFAFDPAPLVCERACVGAAGCGADEFCAPRFSSGLGICRPLPVCGDGEYGEINEVCDDGNTVSGDGCSGDCQTVEYDVLCGALAPLALNATTSDTTLGGIDGFQTSCQFGTARGRLWSVTTPGRGRLHLHLESTTRQTVAVRETCDDGATERGCKMSDVGGTDLVVQISSAHPSPVTALVTAGTVLEEGPFTLTTDFIPEMCGDGVVAGDEVCDDGNTAGNDGCSANCRTIEYGALCALAPVLSTTTANTGDTTGGTEYFEASCSNTLYGSGPERIYHYTAPSAGTLHLTLDQGQGTGFHDLTLAVLDGCGASGTVPELGCSSVVDVEDVSVTLAAGQPIIVLVEGFSADGLGPYMLTATFTP